jgi:hypothetical protein
MASVSDGRLVAPDRYSVIDLGFDHRDRAARSLHPALALVPAIAVLVIGGIVQALFEVIAR